MQALKREIKKIGSLALFFLFGFGYILLIMKLFLKEYSINTYVFSKAIIGALVAAKAVAIMDVTPWMNRFEESPRYLSILYKTSIYTGAVLILGIIEHLLHAYHQTKSLIPAFKNFIGSENIYQVLAVTLCISIVFFIHNILRELETYFGKENVHKFFFTPSQFRGKKSTTPSEKS